MPTCSGCLGEFSGLNDVTAHINTSADAHSKTASEHRVNQPHSKQNQNLAKAAAINEKKARIKLMHKGQVIHVELSMMLIDGRGKHYKCLLAPFPDVYPATDPIEAVLVELAQKLETNFLQSAYCLQFDNTTYDFTFSSCMLNSIHGKKLYSIDKTGLAFKGNLDSLFTKLVSGGHLSKADQDARKLCLQLIVPFTIDEQEHLFKASKASINMSRKRKHLSIADATLLGRAAIGRDVLKPETMGLNRGDGWSATKSCIGGGAEMVAPLALFSTAKARAKQPKKPDEYEFAAKRSAPHTLPTPTNRNPRPKP
ncbi:hypothetical protein F5890DRAFT_1479180 [Lentinula detonsa]|uniref:Uncharacterized protein n=1 Tax=Lentinula detonsa TaxID=2804962 RepID=A0AA38PNZ8_9AGAR|nr:hypothetical protein F5890DRAFT_1479180 [Lentinula detonsa]